MTAGGVARREVEPGVDQNVEGKGQVLLNERLLGGDEVLIGYGDHLDLYSERVAEIACEALGDGCDIARSGEPEGAILWPSSFGE